MLVVFDLKGTFNGVNKVSLDACLWVRRILTVARKWIMSFISNRYTSIGFDDYYTETILLLNIGLV